MERVLAIVVKGVFRLGTQPVSLKIGCYFQIDLVKSN